MASQILITASQWPAQWTIKQPSITFIVCLPEVCPEISGGNNDTPFLRFFFPDLNIFTFIRVYSWKSVYVVLLWWWWCVVVFAKYYHKQLTYTDPSVLELQLKPQITCISLCTPHQKLPNIRQSMLPNMSKGSWNLPAVPTFSGDTGLCFNQSESC